MKIKFVILLTISCLIGMMKEAGFFQWLKVGFVVGAVTMILAFLILSISPWYKL